MSVLLDTGIVYAYYDRDDAWHQRARTFIEGEQQRSDSAGAGRAGSGPAARSPAGRLVADLPREGYAPVAELNRRFDDLDLGFVDAAVVALARALGLARIATTYRRHFEPLAAAFSFKLFPTP